MDPIWRCERPRGTLAEARALADGFPARGQVGLQPVAHEGILDLGNPVARSGEIHPALLDDAGRLAEAAPVRLPQFRDRVIDDARIGEIKRQVPARSGAPHAIDIDAYRVVRIVVLPVHAHSAGEHIPLHDGEPQARRCAADLQRSVEQEAEILLHQRSRDLDPVIHLEMVGGGLQTHVQRMVDDRAARGRARRRARAQQRAAQQEA